MIISSGQIQNVLKAYGINKTEKTREVQAPQKPKGTGNDTVNVSEEARLLQAAMKVVHETPDERAEKVGPLREAVRSGTYSVDGKAIAEKMLGRALMERIGSE